MIIHELRLTNFMCYYNHNIFKLDKGLNIILGHNGDGKSTIFTAFNWIFNPLSILPLKDIFSVRRFAETPIGDAFEVKVEVLLEQYEQLITLEKSFIVTNSSGNAQLSAVQNTADIRDKTTGESGGYNGDIKDLIERVFPTDYRNFSMFETEAETLDLVKGKQLSKLVKQFSNAKFYEKIEVLAQSISKKASKAYQRECNADAKTKERLEDIENNITSCENEIKRLEKIIADDQTGLDTYDKEIEELERNSNLSTEINRIKKEIDDLKAKRKTAQVAVKNKYTEYLFDEAYFLIGYSRFKEKFSSKVDDLRQERNRKDAEERAQFMEEKERLTLQNGATPLPPGSPSEKILNEFKTANICKICDRTLDAHALAYINKSLSIYEKNKKIGGANLKYQNVFTNTFIPELEILDRIIEEDERKLEINLMEQKIPKLIDDNQLLEKEIHSYDEQIYNLEQAKQNIVNQASSNLNEERLTDVLSTMRKLNEKRDELNTRIGRNELKKEQQEEKLEEFRKTKRKTLGQIQNGTFKRETVELLDDLAKVFAETKSTEYQKFLNILGERATNFLKQINTGEITGKIVLSKIGEEVHYKSLNEDNSYRSDLHNSGALQISIPMSILFAIAELASEIRNDESYPMIFDAPTGRFSPDREVEFFKALYESNKQRIIVTLRFLGINESGIYVREEDFNKIPRHKAFWILRERPLVENDMSSINTTIIPL